MAVKPHGTWYVINPESCDERNELSLDTKTFRSELEANQFARQKLIETENVSAGTGNQFSAPFALVERVGTRLVEVCVRPRKLLARVPPPPSFISIRMEYRPFFKSWNL
jgi:hypothetical protein